MGNFGEELYELEEALKSISIERVRFCKIIPVVLNGVWMAPRTEFSVKAGDRIEWADEKGDWVNVGVTVTDAMLQQGSAFLRYFDRFSIFDDIRENACSEPLVHDFREHNKSMRHVGTKTKAELVNDGWVLKQPTEDSDSWYDIWEPKADIVVPTDDMVDAIARSFSAEQKKFSDSIEQLVKALEAGNYNAAPSSLVQGCGLYVEDLSAVLQNVTYDDSHIKLHRTMPRCQFVFPWDGSTPEVFNNLGDTPPGGWPDFNSKPATDWEDITKVDFDMVDVDKFSEHQKPYNHPTYGNANEASSSDHRHPVPEGASIVDIEQSYPRLEDARTSMKYKQLQKCYMCEKITHHVYLRSANDYFPCCIKCANDINGVVP